MPTDSTACECAIQSFWMTFCTDGESREAVVRWDVHLHWANGHFKLKLIVEIRKIHFKLKLIVEIRKIRLSGFCFLKGWELPAQCASPCHTDVSLICF